MASTTDGLMRHKHSSFRVRFVGIIAIVFGWSFAATPLAQSQDTLTHSATSADIEDLAKQLEPWTRAFQNVDTPCEFEGSFAGKILGTDVRIELTLRRWNGANYDLALKHPDYEVEWIRRDEVTAMRLPKHRKVIWGIGDVDRADAMVANDLGKRWMRPTTSVARTYDLIAKLDNEGLASSITSILGGARGNASSTWKIGGLAFDFAPSHSAPSDVAHWSIQGEDFRGNAVLRPVPKDPYARDANEAIETWIARVWPEDRQEQIERDEIERTFVRGVRRALEVLSPSERLIHPKESVRKASHGELRWMDGHRVALLYGTPEEIGESHAQLLKVEAHRCIDSVLHSFGLAQTIRTGEWFRKTLSDAYAKLRPHIPERHLVETRSLAKGLDIDPEVLEAVNVFPELFHCSGFAIFGSATEGGKLYHGRVLDYMTTIGLQDAATTFIIAPEGQNAFANVGYAGFIGSVSGMNEQQISLGEMGGKGEGQWDGVPMATLMRRALEECDSLDEVKALWKDSPRTCEYFYVFADGETRSAVGVAATPQNVEFVESGASHPLLGTGIPDAVVLSAGDRLEELRKRVVKGHGRFDVESSQQLMCRPVAMTSNLHNVLFVPEDCVLYVAHASHDQPAAERPYVRIDLRQCVEEIHSWRKPTGAAVTQWEAHDSLQLGLERESSDDAKQCLTHLGWEPTSFQVTVETPSASMLRQGCDAIVRFPSPCETGDSSNDQVTMEWYRADGNESASVNAPAMVVIHESGRGMTVGRLIARGLSKQGIHALMMHLPSYGLRRGSSDPRRDSETMIRGLRQGVADARRAKDAVSVLPGIDKDRIGLQGTSLGGFVVATTTGIDDAYHRSIILLAGGNLFAVLQNGDRDASRTREELAKYGVTLEAIRDALYTIEPLRLAHRVVPEKTWLITGTHDTVVPPENSREFAEAAKLSADHHIEMFADHYSGVVLLPGVIRQMAEIVSER